MVPFTACQSPVQSSCPSGAYYIVWLLRCVQPYCCSVCQELTAPVCMCASMRLMSIPCISTCSQSKEMNIVLRSAFAWDIVGALEDVCPLFASLAVKARSHCRPTCLLSIRGISGNCLQSMQKSNDTPMLWWCNIACSAWCYCQLTVQMLAGTEMFHCVDAFGRHVAICGVLRKLAFCECSSKREPQ